MNSIKIKTNYGKELDFYPLKIEDGVQTLRFICKCDGGYEVSMHAHMMQDEHLKVIEGELEYKISGDDKIYILKKGESAVFKKEVLHSFKNASSDKSLVIEATVKPALNTKEFCIAVSKLLEKGDGKKMNIFDSSYLFWKYRKYHRVDGNWKYFTILPFFYFLGKILSKHNKFKRYNI